MANKNIKINLVRILSYVKKGSFSKRNKIEWIFSNTHRNKKADPFYVDQFNRSTVYSGNHKVVNGKRTDYVYYHEKSLSGLYGPNMAKVARKKYFQSESVI